VPQYVHQAQRQSGSGEGARCFGDWGGPDLLSGTDIILGVNAFVNNSNCRGCAPMDGAARAVQS
jgi:hypothetical protein